MTPLAPPALAVVPPVPRVVHFITVKRNVALAGRSYGHWWVELDGDESYGWWPAQAPVTTRCLFRGGPGVLNGSSGGGNATRDPNHGLAADYEFHPVLVAQRSDDQIRQAIRFFAATFRGEWRWSTRPTMNCRLFQTGALRRRWPRRRHRELPHARRWLPGPGPAAPPRLQGDRPAALAREPPAARPTRL